MNYLRARIRTTASGKKPSPWHGGAATRQRGILAHAEEKVEGKWAQCVPYHSRKLRRRLEVEDWRRRGQIVAAHGRVDGNAKPRSERWHGGVGSRVMLGCRGGLGWHKGAAVAKKGLGRPLRAGHPCNGFRASRVFVAAHPNPSLG
jgi:hypothetical protein